LPENYKYVEAKWFNSVSSTGTIGGFLMETATELEFLKWWYCKCDFGPADGDVQHFMKKRFIEQTGKKIPEGYEFED
jgi:hypothetical protein